MKHGQLRSVGHSLADSLGSGCSLMTGFYDLDVYGDAARSAGGHLVVDLLHGKVLSGTASAQLSEAVSRLPPEFERLCAAQGISRSDCISAQASFGVTQTGCGFTLMVEDRNGRVTEADYFGVPARRTIDLDLSGRIRRRGVRRLAGT